MDESIMNSESDKKYDNGILENPISNSLDPFLAPSDDRFVLFPIKYQSIWELYKRQMAVFWTAEELDLEPDRVHWKKLNNDEKHFISHVLSFFAASDGIVGENPGFAFL